MEDSFQLGDNGVVKSVAKTGRRARQAAEQTPLDESRPLRKSSSTSAGEDEEDVGSVTETAGPPKSVRRQGGWAEDSSGAGSAKSSRRPALEDQEDRRLQPQTPHGSDDEGGEGPLPVSARVKEVEASGPSQSCFSLLGIKQIQAAALTSLLRKAL
ncbi:intraflagellar transport protein 43 homolog isoform X1 [Gadus macrocephalus]|uniref:intraflagellar transport protein 43 homolog isoform X1 n=1 Tax=Gadus macrocephalus TaxID=80720 RepID=UPI0028CB42F2|nr:intraflagellar transport protein 43 homolog isoform X1 [Gadus macrocephalus]